jgi:DNA-binding transcriptional MerR regulator
MSAPEAAEAAGITYRQLDYWDRQHWVRASAVEKVGAGRSVRRYDARVVVQLAAMARLGRSGVDLATFAKALGTADLRPGRALVVGPFGVGDAVAKARAVPRDDVLDAINRPGRWVVYDPSELWASLTRARETGVDTTEIGSGAQSA